MKHKLSMSVMRQGDATKEPGASRCQRTYMYLGKINNVFFLFQSKFIISIFLSFFLN